MELSDAQKQAAIAQIVARENAVDRDPTLESMRNADCCGLREEVIYSAVRQSAVETHTKGGVVSRSYQEAVITDLRKI